MTTAAAAPPQNSQPKIHQRIFTFFSLCIGDLKIKIGVLPDPFLMKDCFLQIPH
jgi:hypothetical protein